MRAGNRFVAALIFVGLVVGVLFGWNYPALAQAPARSTSVVVPYTEYEWWMYRWEDNAFACQILIDHDGYPTIKEVSKQCGAELATAWWNTPACKPNKAPCQGYYIYFVSSTPKQREITVELPPPVAWIGLEGCDPAPPDNLCPELPTLVITGEEPLPNQQIISIQGTYDGDPFTCDGSVCKLPMRTTPIEGVTVDFWANSSYGNSSNVYTAQVRVIDSGVGTAPENIVPGASGFYVDIISTQWQGEALTSCAKIWEAFPPVGETPEWLKTPEHFELMASGDPYFYLAGRMIAQGLVDASTCPNNGLMPNGYADACGLDTARPVVEDWQNQFDNRIIQSAKDSGVPAQLMKNLFAQESQFWPGMYRVPYEFGLGQITDNGTDAIFIWNPEFFNQFCPLVLSSDACAQGYLGLSADEQALLRGALALQARADCSDCPAGIDLTNVYFTVSLFANTLQANCAQVARTVFTATGQMAGRVATYEDLWKLTVANYHAGPGCTSFAIFQGWQLTGKLTWEDVSTRFTPACQGVAPYVNEIAK